MANMMGVEVIQSLIALALKTILHDPSCSLFDKGALEEMCSKSYKLEEGHTIHSEVAWVKNKHILC